MGDNDTLIIIGAAAAALLIFRKEISGLFKGATETSESIGNVTTAAGDAAVSWIDLLNLQKDAEYLKNAFSGLSTNNYYYTQNKTDTANYGADVISGNIPSIFSQSKTPAASGGYSSNWLTITPKNTQTIMRAQTAAEAIDTARNPNIKNIVIPIGTGAMINKKPVSLPPSLLKIALGGY